MLFIEEPKSFQFEEYIFKNLIKKIFENEQEFVSKVPLFKYMKAWSEMISNIDKSVLK